MPDAPDNSEPNYFSKPSTRWDMVKFVIPFLITLGVALVNIYYTQLSQAKTLEEQKTNIERIETSRQTAREDVFKRLAVLEEIAKRQSDDLKEIRGDVKSLLARNGGK
jgi:16S rRNA U1498 N3-methylase RsmE